MRFLFVNLIVAGFGVTGLVAQSTVDQHALASQLRSNQEELRKYSWKSKYTYKIDGVQKRVEEYTVKYFPDGTFQKMQVSRQQDKEKVRGTDGKKFSKKEREAGYDFVMDVKSQLDSYLNPMLAEKAVKTATKTASEDTLILKSESVVSRGDSVEIRYSMPDHIAKTASVKTSVHGSIVTLEIEFGTMEVGPNYTKRSVTTATWQGLQLEIIAENSDYKRTKRY